MATERDNEDRSFLQPGEDRLVRLACPDCGGGPAQVDLPQISYLGCHVGHQYAPETLVAALAETSEHRLWTAVSALEEEILLQDHLQGSGSVASTVPAASILRRQDLASRVAELREQVQRWTGTTLAGDGPPDGQPPTGERS